MMFQGWDSKSSAKRWSVEVLIPGRSEGSYAFVSISLHQKRFHFHDIPDLDECDWIAWRDVTILFKEDLLRRTLVPDAPIDHNDWFSRLKGIVEKGAVSRNIAVPGNVTYVMGAISPNERLASGDWIWKPYQPNEVLALGISI